MRAGLVAPLALLTLSGAGLAAQAAEMTVVIEDHAITGPSLAPHVEPHLAASPGDPRHLVAGVIVAGPERDEKPWHCAALVSWDGGRSWIRRTWSAPLLVTDLPGLARLRRADRAPGGHPPPSR